MAKDKKDENMINLEMVISRMKEKIMAKIASSAKKTRGRIKSAVSFVMKTKFTQKAGLKVILLMALFPLPYLVAYIA